MMWSLGVYYPTLPKVRGERIRCCQRISAIRASGPVRALSLLADYPTLYRMSTSYQRTVFSHTGSEFSKARLHPDWMVGAAGDSKQSCRVSSKTPANPYLRCLLRRCTWLGCATSVDGLKATYRYSIGLVYNTFPVPPVPRNDCNASNLTLMLSSPLAPRYPNATLADLYDPDLMPVELRRAHRALDGAVDRLYRRSPFSSDRERVEHLLGLYERMMVPLAASATPRRRRRRR